LNERNEHGNSPLHYACFGNYRELAILLIENGARLSLENKYGQTPLEKARQVLANELKARAVQMDQDLSPIPYQSKTWLGTAKPHTIRLQDKHDDLDMKALNIKGRLVDAKAYSILKGKWNDSDVLVKILILPRSITVDSENENKPLALSSRHLREFQEEYAKTRIFSHQNLLPALGIVSKIQNPPTLAIVSQWMPVGSLNSVLHGGKGIPVVDNNAIKKFAVDIARGMKFLHDMQPDSSPRFRLNSKHIVIDGEQNARLDLASSDFSIQGSDKIYDPAWMAPEALAPISPKGNDFNRKKADMWSFSIVLWEMVTHEIPFVDLSPMQIGIQVAHENLRVRIPNGITPNMAEVIRICMKDEPSKRPTFEQIVPILVKMADN